MNFLRKAHEEFRQLGMPYMTPLLVGIIVIGAIGTTVLLITAFTD